MALGTSAGQLLVVATAVLGLWVGARALVDAVVNLARRHGVAELTIGLTIVAMGTSTPELVVTVGAALDGLGDIAAGNVIGSNIYNLAFILGGVSLLRVVPVERSLVHRDGIALLLATAAGFVTLLDRAVTTVEGIALVAVFVGYAIYLVRDERAEASIETTYPDSRIARIATGASFRGRDGIVFLGGLALVLVSGHFLVDAATALARTAGVSDWVIGETVVAAGTSTPEFAVSLVALRRGHVGMSVGNVVGSNIFNVLGILGLAAALRPIAVTAASLQSLVWLAVITGMMVAGLWSGRKLSQFEGFVFVLSELARWILGLFRVI